MLCVLILYIILYIRVDSERQIFLETILFTLRVFARNLLRVNRRRNTFCILFSCLTWGSNPGFGSNKPTHHLLDYGVLPANLSYTSQSYHSKLLLGEAFHWKWGWCNHYCQWIHHRMRTMSPKYIVCWLKRRKTRVQNPGLHQNGI